MAYSHSNIYGGDAVENGISTITKKNREKIKKGLDKFTTFKWKNQDAFENYGAFIVNSNMQDIKFYNGPSYSNSYTAPQFSSGNASLVGINFKTQEIAFKVALYWFDIKTYRKFLNWLNPFDIGMLSFGYSSDYGYMVKPSKISEGSRVIVGYEGEEPMYMTELTLTFEVQGEPCARAIESYILTEDSQSSINQNDNFHKHTWSLTLTNTMVTSDLSTPFTIVNKLKFENKSEDWQKYESFFEDLIINIKLILRYNTEDNTEEKNLYNISLKNITFTDSALNIFNFKYISETGMVLLEYGDSVGKILSLLETDNGGKKIIETLEVAKCFLPGMLDNEKISYENFKFEFGYSLSNNGSQHSKQIENESENKTWSNFYELLGDTLFVVDDKGKNKVSFESYARTNIA